MSSTAAAPSFTKPTRQILSPVNVSAWLHSEAYTIYTKMLMDLNECVKRKSTTEQCTVSPAVQSVIGVLDKIGSYIADFPPKDLDEQRFGNKAFRDWHAKVTQEAESLLAGMLPDTQKAAAVELAAYFLDSFGNATRIDYGSGSPIYSQISSISNEKSHQAL
uniref:Serine/threonine-protein phosphatase 2A activator n=1 Tax=Plectus sambesii TaxID=2011161 RepID=A0A914W8Q0_9BILA